MPDIYEELEQPLFMRHVRAVRLVEAPLGPELEGDELALQQLPAEGVE